MNMTDEELNVALAECLGFFNFYQGTNGGDLVADYRNPATGEEKVGFCIRVPCYCTDLNAVHEVERGMQPKQTFAYIEALYSIVDPKPAATWAFTWLMLTASARHRAEALLRTLRNDL